MTKQELIPEISRRIRELRERQDLSQKALGLLVGVTDAAITMWETGKRFPRGKNLKKLANALGVTESAILEGFDTDQVGEANRNQLIVDIIATLPSLNDRQLSRILTLATGFLSGSESMDSVKKITR
jgi:transcriptional regulator with XRE-family HTH domain